MYEDWQFSRTQRAFSSSGEWLKRFHLDSLLLTGIGLLMLYGLFVLYSAAGENVRLWQGQIVRFVLALGIMVILAMDLP